MSRHTNASAVRDLSAQTHDTPAHAPANTNSQDPAAAQPAKPRNVLTPAQRATLLARVIALPQSSVQPLPAYVRERLTWMADIQATASGDRDDIARTELAGRVVSAEEIDDLGHCIEFAREALDYDSVTIVRDAALGQGAEQAPERMSDDALMAKMSDCRTTICDALKRHLPAGSDARTEVLRIRNDERRSAHADNNRFLITLFESKPMLKWLQSLPKKEGVALALLKTCHAEWLRRAEATGVSLDESGVPFDFAQRAFALAVEPMAAVLNVGRYLTEGVLQRKRDYPGFRKPRPAPKRTEAVVHDPPAPSGATPAPSTEAPVATATTPSTPLRNG